MINCCRENENVQKDCSGYVEQDSNPDLTIADQWHQAVGRCKIRLVTPPTQMAPKASLHGPLFAPKRRIHSTHLASKIALDSMRVPNECS